MLRLKETFEKFSRWLSSQTIEPQDPNPWNRTLRYSLKSHHTTPTYVGHRLQLSEENNLVTARLTEMKFIIPSGIGRSARTYEVPNKPALLVLNSTDKPEALLILDKHFANPDIAEGNLIEYRQWRNLVTNTNSNAPAVSAP